MPIPLGFGEEDLNVEAPKLFSDSFYLLYLKHISNDKELFLGSYFDEKRPLTVIEISHIVSSIQTNLIAKDLILGFAQTAPSQEIQAFC
ncbi:DUF3231 family protein [Priestia megaterium]